jgi:hypothetical protein
MKDRSHSTPRYQGSCHCGAIRFEIDAVIDRASAHIPVI